MRGRKPKPAEVREKEGGRSVSHRKQVAAAVVGDAIDPVNGDTLEAPEYLAIEVADVWDEVVPALVDVGLARSVDIPALEALCTHIAIARGALEYLEQSNESTREANGGRSSLDLEKFVDYTERGVPVVSPYHRIFRDSWREALKLAEHYGLTPISRTRLGIAALQQRSLAEQLQSIMGDDSSAGDEVNGEVVGVFDAPTCLGCGVSKGRKHGVGCARPGFSTMKALDPGEVVPQALP